MAREGGGGGCGSEPLCAAMRIYVATMFSCQQRVLFGSAESVEQEGQRRSRVVGGSVRPPDLKTWRSIRLRRMLRTAERSPQANRTEESAAAQPRCRGVVRPPD
jgi:hypothetical protein